MTPLSDRYSTDSESDLASTEQPVLIVNDTKTRIRNTENNHNNNVASKNGQSTLTSPSATTNPPQHATAGPGLTPENEIPESKQDDEDDKESDFVPRNERGGLFPEVCLIRERKLPQNYNSKIKLLITFAVSFAAMVGPMGGSIFLPAMQDIAKDLNTSKDVVNVSYGLYVLSLGIFPIWWSSISEQFGRRAVYVISFTMYTGFLVGCAMSSSIGMLMGFRILSGAGAAAVQAVGAGTIGDIYINTERGTAMGYFYLGPLVGPLIGPLAGGAIVTRWGWKGTQWFLTIVSGVILGMILFCLPETLRQEAIPSHHAQPARDIEETGFEEKVSEDKVSEKKVPREEEEEAESSPIERHLSAKSQSSRNIDGSAESDLIGDTVVPCMSQAYSYRSEANEQAAAASAEDKPVLTMKQQGISQGAVDFGSLSTKSQAYLLVIKPLHSLKFLTYPPVLCSVLYSSFCFFCLYFLNVSLESLFTGSPYNFGPVIVGCTYLPNSVGYVVSSLVGGRWSDRVVKKVKARNNGVFIAESRYASHVFLGAFLYPLAIIMFGWTAEKRLGWYVPLIASFLYGLSSMIIFGTAMTYLVDALPGRGSSGVAVNNLARMVLAAVATFVASPLEDALGYGWMYTMWGIIGLSLVGLIVLIKVKGKEWREKVNLDELYK